MPIHGEKSNQQKLPLSKPWCWTHKTKTIYDLFLNVKEIKETRYKGLKESMTMMSDQGETINKDTKITNRNNIKILELKSIITENDIFIRRIQ